MKNFVIGVVLVVASFGCGMSSRQNETVAQVKKVVSQTPIICGDRVDADLSLGVMRNGVGSLSTEDLWVYVPNQEDQKLLKSAAEQGKLVKVTFDVKRLTICTSDHIVSHVELMSEK